MYSNIVVVLSYIWRVYFMVKYFLRIIGFGRFVKLSSQITMFS